MITTELYKGQGLGNQLWCYVVTRAIAKKRGFDFGIESPQNFKGGDFMQLDFGQKPIRILNTYHERSMFHPINNADITLHDPGLLRVSDNTKILGVMQDEKYISEYKDEIREWLIIKDIDVSDCIDENTCVLNFRGGEYARHPEIYLQKKYWIDAINNMKELFPGLKFIVITDDVKAAREMLPEISAYHFDIAKDYTVISKANYLILSNSSFAWFPAWLSKNLKYCIAPKYWGRHNISDGYWSAGYNITSGWMYQDRDGKLQNYDSCLQEFETYIKNHSNYFAENNATSRQRPRNNIVLFLKKKIGEILPERTKNLIFKTFRIKK